MQAAKELFRILNEAAGACQSLIDNVNDEIEASSDEDREALTDQLSCLEDVDNAINNALDSLTEAFPSVTKAAA